MPTPPESSRTAARRSAARSRRAVTSRSRGALEKATRPPNRAPRRSLTTATESAGMVSSSGAKGYLGSAREDAIESGRHREPEEQHHRREQPHREDPRWRLTSAPHGLVG